MLSRIFLSYIRLVKFAKSWIAYDWGYLGEARCVHEVCRLDPSDELSVVDDFAPWLDQSVKHNVPVEVDDTDASKSFALLGQYSLAIE